MSSWCALGFSPVLKGGPGVTRVRAKNATDMKTRSSSPMNMRLMT